MQNLAVENNWVIFLKIKHVLLEVEEYLSKKLEIGKMHCTLWKYPFITSTEVSYKWKTYQIKQCYNSKTNAVCGS